LPSAVSTKASTAEFGSAKRCAVTPVAQARRGRGVIGTPAGRGENFKLTGSVSEGPESERSEKGAAVFCFGDGGDAFFGFIAAQFKFSIAVTQGPGGLQNDPQITLGVGHQRLDGADGQGGGSGLGELTESQSIKTVKTFLGADPQIAVRSLGDGGNGTAGESAGAAPAVVNILRGHAIGIDRARGKDKTNQQNGGERSDDGGTTVRWVGAAAGQRQDKKGPEENKDKTDGAGRFITCHRQ